jgi:hypothetical protein
MISQLRRAVAIFSCVFAASAAQLATGQTSTVSTAFGSGADIELTENGGVGTATAGGNGTKINMNARWNFANMPPTGNPDRNEWAAMRFDLSEHADKSSISNLTLNFYMHRANANNNKNLHFYALAPGMIGEDWDEATTTYATMPGFTFDSDSTTNVLATGTTIIDLGNFATMGVEAEGALAEVTLPGLTTLVQGMGTNNLLTVLVSTAGSTNGQWRALTKEASGSEFNAISGNVGDFAPFLEFDTSVVEGLPGDYNENDIVDAADYTVWRNNFGSATALPNDDSEGVADDDYDRWKTNFGMTLGGGGSAAGSTVPEPSAMYLAIVAAAAAAPRKRRRRAVRAPAA